MLDIVKRSEPATNQFVRPYFIQTDSGGIISASEKTIQLPSIHNINNYLYKNLSEIFCRSGKTLTALNNRFPKIIFPGAFDLSICLRGKRSLSIRWISTLSYWEYETLQGWKLTGMEIPGRQQDKNSYLTEEHSLKEKELSDLVNIQIPI